MFVTLSQPEPADRVIAGPILALETASIESADPLIDGLLASGAVLAAVEPTEHYEHPGAALNRQYEAFSDLNKRDSWYQGLDSVDREDLSDYRRLLRQGKAA